MKRIKQIAALFMGLLLIFTLAACGNKQTSGDSQPETKENSASSDIENETISKDDTESENGSKALVVYFSRTGEQYTVGVIDKGNTAIVAEMIAEETGADLFEILPEEDYYPTTYGELTEIAQQEQYENTRPAYQGPVPDLSCYDTVFIGAPVWWGDWPMIMYTFFENEDLSGKTLIPFSTHEGSGLAGFDKKLAAVCPNSEILKGLAIRGNDAQNKQDWAWMEVKAWLTELGY